MAHGLSCSAACGILPGPGLEPMSPALAGGFLTTVPPGKSLAWFYLDQDVTDPDRLCQEETPVTSPTRSPLQKQITMGLPRGDGFS